MWNLWLKAKNFSQLPSFIFGEEDSLAAWMLDSAVQWFGITIENALAERIEVKMATKTESKPRYTLVRLLNPATKLPRPLDIDGQQGNPWSSFAQLIGKRGGLVKRYQYVGPKKEEDNA